METIWSSKARGIAVAGAVALGFAFAVPACSLTSGLGGFSSGGSPPPAAADAGTTPSGSDDTDSGSTEAFRCEGRSAVFCADFEAVPWPVPFSPPDRSGVEAVIEGTGLFGRGLVARAPERTSGDRPGAEVDALTPVGPRQDFTVSLDVKLDRVTGAGEFFVTLFYYAEGFYVATLRVENDGRAFLDEYADGSDSLPEHWRKYDLATGVAAEKWTHVVVSVKFAGQDATARLTLDGVLAFEGPIAAGRYPRGNLFAVAGLHAAHGPGPAVTATIDNVVITSP